MTREPTPSATIYVRLLHEGTDAWAPATGRKVGPMSFEVLRPADYNPDAEAWEFPPGTIVLCEWRRDRGDPKLLATARAVPPPDFLARPRSVIEFAGRRDPGYAPWIDTLVDGRPLEALLSTADELKERKGAGPWLGSEPYELLPPQGNLLGGRGAVQLLVCAGCREPGCDPVYTAIEVFDGEVVWSEFHQGNMTTKLCSVGPFVFDRKQYETAVARAVEWDARTSPPGKVAGS